MPTIHWLTLEIGYESFTADTCTAAKPHLQEVLETLVSATKLKSWDKRTPMIVGSVSTDRWVATFLQAEINFALAERHAQHARPGVPDSLIINENRLVRYQRPLGGFSPSTVPSGEPGTRCKLRGGIWVNTRSYSLFKTDGTMWLASEVPANSIVFAALTWECQLVRESNLQSPTAIT